MRKAWSGWVILTAVSALLFSMLAAPAAFGAVVLDGPRPVTKSENEAEKPDDQEGEDGEPKSPEEVLEKMLERIQAVFQKCLEALRRALKEASEEAGKALELAISNVERVREWFAERGEPPYKGGPLADRPKPGGEEGEKGEGGKPDIELPVQPPIPEDLPVTPPVPWKGR